MKVKALSRFKCKLFNPCEKILRLFNFRLRKPLFIRRLRFRRKVHKTEGLRRRGREEDQVMELKTTRKEVPALDDVEDACRSFENYLVEMIVEEGNMRDLADVEELLYCWKNLKSPVFIELVSRFYGELCRDLFSNSYEDNVNTPKRLL
ncbi:hypothetical protein R3W88_002292 [Solanum pinnatisectum]|uniref:OVATE domain-containing protein n=1 Tax=Solanum pinnatisectum TaxID=50273 RepID=A0AAV9MKP3_9SOLN|nr:hypothetical protein R3W88_002292 [Solanum pinnatisectum]